MLNFRESCSKCVVSALLAEPPVCRALLLEGVTMCLACGPPHLYRGSSGLPAPAAPTCALQEMLLAGSVDYSPDTWLMVKVLRCLIAGQFLVACPVFSQRLIMVFLFQIYSFFIVLNDLLIVLLALSLVI